MEEDVVAACVDNALIQGCERVYLVDNNSTDRTVEAATLAGATLAATFSTTFYDEHLRMSIMQAVVDHASRSVAEDCVWWLWLDADEFAHGPSGLTIRDYLATLDIRFRVVGARYVNHYPTVQPHYVPGFHPLDFQPACEEYSVAWNCAGDHHKHPLLRVDRHAPRIVPSDGFHSARADVQLLEPDRAIFLHHFPYREEAVTRKRLDLLCAHSTEDEPRISFHDTVERGDESNSTIRHRNLDAVYQGRWADVRERRGSRLSSVDPRAWSALVSEADAKFARWYDVVDLGTARGESPQCP